MSASINYSIPGNFREIKIRKNIFANDPRVQYKRCGMAIISQLSKIRENFPVYSINTIANSNSSDAVIYNDETCSSGNKS